MTMIKGLFFAVLLVTLLVNLVFLFATKDKPPDLATSTFMSIQSEQASKTTATGHRRLFLRSDDYHQDYTTISQPEDESSPLNNTNPTKPTTDFNVNDRNSNIDASLNRSAIHRDIKQFQVYDPVVSLRTNQNIKPLYESSSIDYNLIPSRHQVNSIETPRTESANDRRIHNNERTEEITGGLIHSTGRSWILTKSVTTNQINRVYHRVLVSKNIPVDSHDENTNSNELIVRKSKITPEKVNERLNRKLRDYLEVGKTNVEGVFAKVSRSPNKTNAPEAHFNCSKSHECSFEDNDVIDSKKQTISISENVIGSDRGIIQTSIPAQPSWPVIDQSLEIEVKSSRDHVLIKVNNIIVYESKNFNDLIAIIDRGSKKVRRQNNYLSHSSKQITRDDGDIDSGRGIHVIVLNQHNGNIMSKRHYDTYSPNQDKELCFYLNMIQDGRILILAVKDEASFGMPLHSQARKFLSELGSRQINSLGWRDMWACILRKNTKSISGSPMDSSHHRSISKESEESPKSLSTWLAESLNKSPGFSEWGSEIELKVKVVLLDEPKSQIDTCRKSWRNIATESQETNILSEVDRREKFCAKVEGYGLLCDCEYPTSLSFKTQKIAYGRLDHVPIIVMASNRPYYLYRMLRSLLSAHGVKPEMITVFIDGFYEEPMLVSELFNVKSIQQTPRGRKGARISHHYKTSLTQTFELYPQANHVIIFEEDLDVSQDVLVYFNQTMELLDKDPSLYCISAWNDQGYQHTVGDRRLLYRVDTMPGLGWMLKRELYKQELEKSWPAFDSPHDWDMWIRTKSIRKGRDCIIPDISRTFHFGATGTNINSYFQSMYFSKHAFNSDPIKPDGTEHFSNLESLTSDRAYDQHIAELIEAGTVVLKANNVSMHAKEYLCSRSKLTNTNRQDSDRIRKLKYSIIYIRMVDENDFKNWLKLATCWKIWDLDPRGQHKSMWRLFLDGQPTMIIGHPISPYSRLKPRNAEVFDLL